MFDLPDGSYCIADIPRLLLIYHQKVSNFNWGFQVSSTVPVQIYTNKIKNRIILKIKTGYKIRSIIFRNNGTIREHKKKMLIQAKMEKMYQN